MTRDEGLAEIEIPSSTEEQIKDETEYVLKKLDVSEEEWLKILNAPNKTLNDYKNENDLKKPIKRIIRVFKKK